MPAPTLLPNKSDNDERNPSQRHADALADLRGAEKRGTTNMDDFERSLKNDTADSSEEDANVARATEKLRDQEAEGSAPAGNWNVNRSEEKQDSKRSWFTAKKGGTIGGITAILLGVVGIGTTLFTPGLGIVQLKEVLTSDLNDQLSAMDIRSDSVFRSKLSNMSSGICTGVKIQCKFKSMSNRQIEKFKKAGFTIPDDGVKDTLFGRKKITRMIAPDGTEIRDPNDLSKARRSSLKVRSALNRVYNPIYYGLVDKVASSVLKKNKTNRQKKIVGADEESRREALQNTTAGEKANGGVLTDKDGKQYMLDEEGKPVYDEGDSSNKFKELKSASDDKLAQLGDKATVGGKAVGGVLGGAFKGVSVIGAADSACTVYNTARAVSAGAKIARSMQLIQFAMVILSTADSIKAGDATPEEVEFVGNMLTATDTNKKSFDDMTGAEIDNPFYGKSAFDSPGYKTAAYNEAPILTTRSQQYMIGGGLTGTLSTVLSNVEAVISPGSPENIRSVCKVTQSFWVRGAGLVAGVFAAVGSFGTSTVVSMVASLAISLALPFLEAALVDMMAGHVIGDDIKGVDAGDAAFAGSAALLGNMAQARGMTPMSSDGMKEYVAATSESRSEMIAAERYEASKTPFDITNQYSFLGSFARSLYPAATQARTGVASTLASIGSVLKLGLSSIVQPDTAQASQTFNETRLTRCNDPGYNELGIDADVFCNVRYGLTASELAMDSGDVVDYMYSSGYINEDGVAKGSYKDFLDKCVNRTDGWGETSEENGPIGTECIDGRDDTFKDISYFRVFTMDNSINEGMDTDPNTATPVGKYVLPVKPGYSVSASWEMYSPFGTPMMHMGIDLTGGTASQGSPVYAVADGEVIKRGGINNEVVIRHSNGLMSRYLHMFPKDVTLKIGDSVSAGQEIGKVGNYGESTGAHLHFEINVDDQTDAQFVSIGDENASSRGGRNARNPIAIMTMLGVDIVNGGYTDGRD